jgi:hypothetical protein
MRRFQDNFDNPEEKNMITGTASSKRLLLFVLTAMLLAVAIRPVQAEDSKSPQAYFADRIRMEEGQPAVDTIPELYDELDFQRAVQAYVWATPFVALSEMLESLERDFGATLTRQPIFEQSVTPEYLATSI